MSNGVTRRWVVGNSVISITTSPTHIGSDAISNICLQHRQQTSTTLIETGKVSGEASSSKTDKESQQSVAKSSRTPVKHESHTATSGRSTTPEPVRHTTCPDNQTVPVNDYNGKLLQCHYKLM